MTRFDHYREDWNYYGTTDATTTFGVRYPELEIEYGWGQPQQITIKGQLTTATRDLFYGKETKHTVYPGTLTIEDADNNALTIAPTGQGGYTVITGTTPVRVNSKMNETIREHTARCLAYVKPKPVPELEK